MRTITLVRHGESEANAGLASSDPALIPLTARGIAQAEHWARATDWQPARLFSSPYLRAQHTAAPCAARWQMPVETIALLHEFVTLPPDEVAGTTNLQRKPLIDAYWERADPALCTGPGAESFLDLARRVDAVRAQLETLPDRSVVFGHGMWMAMLVWRCMGFPVESLRAMQAFRAFQLGLPMPNCCSYALHGDEGHWAIRFAAALPRELPTPGEQAVQIQ
jgi:broad specificity phosphatase PhoE